MKHVYIVQRKEVYISEIEIEATDEQDALSKVINDEGKEIRLNYLETLDPETWTVQKEADIALSKQQLGDILGKHIEAHGIKKTISALALWCSEKADEQSNKTNSDYWNILTAQLLDIEIDL